MVMKTNEVSRLKELTNSSSIVRQDQLELSAEINALKKKGLRVFFRFHMVLIYCLGFQF